MSRCLIVCGTRPEIIKLAPVYRQLQSSRIDAQWLHTGQHTSVAEQTFSEFSICPDYRIERQDDGTLGGLLASLLQQIGQVIIAAKPQAVLVHGDTSTTLAAALAAFYARVGLIGHVEAGLRSFDLANPFPEESNRKLVAQLAHRHYAPTSTARDNLLHDGVVAEQIVVTGNTIADAQRLLVSQPASAAASSTILVTCHRRENWPHMETICQAIAKLALAYPHYQFDFVMHPNPKLQQTINIQLQHVANVCLLQPMGYQALQQALAASRLVITDSGGIQEEAPTFGVRTLVLREFTERNESISAGYALLAHADSVNDIQLRFAELIARPAGFKSQLYGDGYAAERIINDLEGQLGSGSC